MSRVTAPAFSGPPAALTVCNAPDETSTNLSEGEALVTPRLRVSVIFPVALTVTTARPGGGATENAPLWSVVVVAAPAVTVAFATGVPASSTTVPASDPRFGASVTLTLRSMGATPPPLDDEHAATT